MYLRWLSSAFAIIFLRVCAHGPWLQMWRDMTRTKVRKSLTGVERDSCEIQMLWSHSCRFPTLDSVQKEKIVGWWREAIPYRKETSPTSWTWAEVKKHKKHQAELHTVTKKHTEVLKEPARSTKSNMCCSNYIYIQPSNKNNRSHTIQVNKTRGKKRSVQKEHKFPSYLQMHLASSTVYKNTIHIFSLTYSSKIMSVFLYFILSFVI